MKDKKKKKHKKKNKKPQGFIPYPVAPVIERQPSGHHEQQISNLKPETPYMEVHKHPHHVTHKKKWPEYLLEFLMLFLAVFLGFLAENFREHQVDHKRELQYIHSLIEDLQNDTAEVNSVIPDRKEREASIDSLIYLLNTPNPQKYSSSIYYHSRLLLRTYDFRSTQRTIQQLKNTGSMRLIRNTAVAEIINSYDYRVEMIRSDQNFRREQYMIIYPFLLKIQDALVLEKMIKRFDITRPTGNPALKSTNQEFLKELSTGLHYLKSSETGSIELLRDFYEIVSNYIGRIKKEYHLE